MNIYIDVDNEKRYAIKSDNMAYVKDVAKAIKLGEEGVHFNISYLGVLAVNNVILDFNDRAAIFKCTLLCDFREEENKEDMRRYLYEMNRGKNPLEQDDLLWENSLECLLMM